MKLKKCLSWGLFLCLIFIINCGFLVVGHRGDPTKYPEETIQSDNSAFDSGADYVELDLHISKDNIAVVSHDDDLERMVGTNAIVSQNTFETLSKLQYSNGEHVISLEQLFEYYKNKPNAKFILETKVDHGVDKSNNLEKVIATSIKKYHMENRVMIHSFSAKSLYYFSQLLPNVERIFIVGSLKRINYDTLQYVNAVNVSSDLIKKYPNLVKWLHGSGKKIFVWAEMDESPKLWNWLINNNIDGVVTNFPATGFKYKVAKEGSKQIEINKDATYLGFTNEKTIMNPYQPVANKTKLSFLESIHVINSVQVGNQLYYQLGGNSFVKADYISFDLNYDNLNPYFNSQVKSPSHTKVKVYLTPDHLSYLHKHLSFNKSYKIYGFSGTSKNLWIKTNLGWVQAREILFTNLPINSFAFSRYQLLDANTRYNNIELLSFTVLHDSYTHQFNPNLKSFLNHKALS